MKYIKLFDSLTLDDVAVVGGKNAALGEMIRFCTEHGVRIPEGFAITVDGYWHLIEYNNLKPFLEEKIAFLQTHKTDSAREKISKEIREVIAFAELPDDLAQEIDKVYKQLSSQYKTNDVDVAVRSSATAEDLPGASFAGQQETYLNISGTDALYDAVKKSMASLFTYRAIVYREEKGFDHLKVGLSVGVQKMVRSDKASAGVAFSLDTETGFKDSILINASYGLGELLVQGLIIPDEYIVQKTLLKKRFAPIIKKYLGHKDLKLIYAKKDSGQTEQVAVSDKDQKRFCLDDEEILSLSRMVITLEDYFSKRAGVWTPLDIEWAKDGNDGHIYIVQSRPETVHALRESTTQGRTFISYKTEDTEAYTVLGSGVSIGNKIAIGKARVIEDVADIDSVKKGDIIVTVMTDPDWVPAMKRASGIITKRGGRTCHAAIVSRELGIPAIIGMIDALEVIPDGSDITLDCSKGAVGTVYEGHVAFEKIEIQLKDLKKPDVSLMVNSADPDQAFAQSFLPVDGVGLARIEFIITNSIGVHPMALLYPEQVTKDERKKIDALTVRHAEKKDYFIDTLAQSIGMIAGAFYPRPVIVRLSDFKTNEYRNLIGGASFESEESNPMLGLRGASRYYNPAYQEAFSLECEALKKVRNVMGCTNVAVMIPFVRTLKEAEYVTSLLHDFGLGRGEHDLRYIMMCEVPSNVLLIEEFAQFFDGFSIGSNDLAQLTLAIDRDSEILTELFDERDEAVKKMMRLAIKGAHAVGTTIGICGQAPSDYPEIAQFLIEQKIDSISLNADSVVPFLMRQ